MIIVKMRETGIRKKNEVAEYRGKTLFYIRQPVCSAKYKIQKR